jgi:hypothetical protein
MQYFSTDVTEFLFLLAKHRVHYLIVGGEAVIYYGHARLTGDIDLFYDTAARNVKRLHAALDEFWSGDIPGIAGERELARRGMIFQFGVPPNRIDLITALSGLEFSKSWENKEAVSLSRKRKKFPIYYIGLGDLIANKRAVGRARDDDDLRYLTAARRRRRRRS